MSTHRCCPNGSETIASYPAGATVSQPRADEYARGHRAHVHYDPDTDTFTVARALPAMPAGTWTAPAAYAAFGR